MAGKPTKEIQAGSNVTPLSAKQQAADGIYSGNEEYLARLQAEQGEGQNVPDAWAAEFAQTQDGDDDLLARHRQAIQRLAKPSISVPVGKVERAQAMPTEPEFRDVEFPSRAIYLIHAYRVHGHLHANIDPLRLRPPKPSPELELAYYGLSDADLDVSFPTGDLAGPPRRTLRDILEVLHDTYCGSIGPEFMHITDSAPKHWLQERLERVRSKPQFDDDTRCHIFQRIMRSVEFERFLHTRYVGQKRFSLEGGESLVPMLDAIVQHSGDMGCKELILGMAHRGRLNVLANIMSKSLGDVFAEFEGRQFEDAELGSGDVKYHLGYSSDIRTPGGVVHLSLAFNPSHLEIITPVALGSVRARQRRRDDAARREVMAVLVHGDAAFAGQGVVAESLNLSKLSGFRTGGTIHIVVNNQVGFTTNPFDARSTVYCTDIAKMVQAPILHVNGDDPEAVTMAAMLAVEYRNHFKQDVVIDMVCYRRHGHNEADTPAVTQPVMCRKIASHRNIAQIYRNKLVGDGVMTNEQAEALMTEYRDSLEEIRRSKGRTSNPPNSLLGRWEGYLSKGAPEPKTAAKAEHLDSLARKVHSMPMGFTLHDKVERIYDARIEMMSGKRPVDWGCAETMAYATLLDAGGWVRISGQDTGRGTFFHRHVVVYDQMTGKKYVPLRKAERGDIGHFVAVDSMLSEEAVMAFEFGYSVAEPRALVIWEAQYGDFANNAQVVIDQFISSSESKWGRMSGLVLWLPHGYEGQGAEHSSARLERYLQLCAEENIQIVYPTTPAQLFHLLRRQSMIKMRKPLIMMAPKSMLRQKLSFSNLKDFTRGRFEAVLPESDADVKPSHARRLLLCSGKVYYELLAVRRERGITDVGIVRIERLYPFPRDGLLQQTSRYPKAVEVAWVQEEPKNQGAWYQTKHHLKRCLLPSQMLHQISRDAAAAPAVGSLKRHQEQQQALVDKALGEEHLEQDDEG